MFYDVATKVGPFTVFFIQVIYLAIGDSRKHWSGCVLRL